MARLSSPACCSDQDFGNDRAVVRGEAVVWLCDVTAMFEHPNPGRDEDIVNHRAMELGIILFLKCLEGIIERPLMRMFGEVSCIFQERGGFRIRLAVWSGIEVTG